MQLVTAKQIRNEIINAQKTSTDSIITQQSKIIREKLLEEIRSKNPKGYITIDFNPNPVLKKK